MKNIFITFFLTLLLVVSTGCTKPHDNEPLKVGINEKISSQILYLGQILGYYSADEIKISTVKTDVELSAELSSGKIDVATIRLARAQKMVKESNAFKIIFYMRISPSKADIPEPSSNPNMNVLIMRKSIAEKNAQKVSVLLDGWNSTLTYINNHPDQTIDSFGQQLKIESKNISSELKEASLLFLLSDK
ncbi:ABC transporter substrate-binding protein [Sulfuricurvum sp.]|uniref:ABC transporter substrate-binding protein n=1 Tax=Sulfuricurvum sp. TaxID=2025608 RepID=UPI00356B24A7